MIGLRLVTYSLSRSHLHLIDKFRVAGWWWRYGYCKDRAEKSTTLIANTAQMAAMRIMCGAVIKDFDTNGVMFRGIDRNTTDPTKLKNKIVELYDRFLGEKGNYYQLRCC